MNIIENVALYMYLECYHDIHDTNGSCDVTTIST